MHKNTQTVTMLLTATWTYKMPKMMDPILPRLDFLFGILVHHVGHLGSSGTLLSWSHVLVRDRPRLQDSVTNSEVLRRRPRLSPCHTTRRFATASHEGRAASIPAALAGTIVSRRVRVLNYGCIVRTKYYAHNGVGELLPSYLGTCIIGGSYPPKCDDN